ncbi:MAG: hypothetical protein WBI12_01520 [Methanosarcina flavescens]|uniref:Uncharacterized protein n=1 Tax=Methanosarcina flavescens TaxID=1715806 RepID=A0A660HVP4_9EURY|nr:hypothetical protein [Methanosarcina flavescens]AYK16324.1 hypothetical protein AOB57_005125 [Methanosarcina flavescens]NLK32411.1 hypothetical protein [Methanosarcina flavescens]
MNRLEKNSSFKQKETTFRFFSALLLLIMVCSWINPAFAAAGEKAIGEKRQMDAVITDFFSDNEFADVTVQFEKPLENASLIFTLNSGKKLLKSETFFLGSVEKGRKFTKVLFWGVEKDFREDRDSYTAQVFVKNGSESVGLKELSFSYRNPALSKLKLVDFSADSEKASVLMSLTNPAGFGSVQLPEPGVVDLDLKLLSGTDVIYSEKQKNIPVTNTYYNASYWPFLLEKGKNYTAFLKVHSHSPDITTAYRSDFIAQEKVEILDLDIDVDEYGASITIIGRSQVPFDGFIRVVLTSENGEVQVFEETPDILTAGKEDTVGIIWQGVPKGDYNVKIYVLNLEGEILDSHETVLRVFEPVTEANPIEESPGTGFLAAMGIILCAGVLSSRKK